MPKVKISLQGVSLEGEISEFDLNLIEASQLERSWFIKILQKDGVESLVNVASINLMKKL